MSSNNEIINKQIIYINEKYNNIDYLNKKIDEARIELNNNISTCIIEKVLEVEYNRGFKQYCLSGYIVVKNDWEYYAHDSFIIKKDEAEYIKEIKAKLYKYPLDDYSVGTNRDLIV